MKAGKIIVIDDELDVRIYLTAALTDHGFDAHSAENSREGLALVMAQHPDLVCLDLLMPEQTGVSLYKEIRSNPDLDDVRVLIISGLGIEESIDEVLVGLPIPDGYIEKPVELQSFIQTVRELVQTSRVS